MKKENTKLIGVAAIGIGLWFLLKPKTAAATTAVVPPTTAGGDFNVTMPVDNHPPADKIAPVISVPVALLPLLPEPVKAAPVLINTPVNDSGIVLEKVKKSPVIVDVIKAETTTVITPEKVTPVLKNTPVNDSGVVLEKVKKTPIIVDVVTTVDDVIVENHPPADKIAPKDKIVPIIVDVPEVPVQLFPIDIVAPKDKIVPIIVDVQESNIPVYNTPIEKVIPVLAEATPVVAYPSEATTSPVYNTPDDIILPDYSRNKTSAKQALVQDFMAGIKKKKTPNYI
jgi:hypothetical protein